MRECDYCHKEFPDDKVEFVADPFLADVHDEIEMAWLCNDCYQERRDEI